MFCECFFIKYADGSTVSLLQENETSHSPVVDDFLHRCEQSYLQINIAKTEDTVIDFRRNTHMHEDTLIKGQTMEAVQSFNYLGTVINDKLNFVANYEAVCKKGQQHLHCLRKLLHFHIDRTIMTMFYCAFIELFLSFSLMSWFGHVSLKEKNALNQIVKWSS